MTTEEETTLDTFEQYTIKRMGEIDRELASTQTRLRKLLIEKREIVKSGKSLGLLPRNEYRLNVKDKILEILKENPGNMHYITDELKSKYAVFTSVRNVATHLYQLKTKNLVSNKDKTWSIVSPQNDLSCSVLEGCNTLTGEHGDA